MMAKAAIIPALMILLAGAAPGWAEDVKPATAEPAKDTAAKPSQPVDVESDQMEVLDKEKKAIFRGNVVAKRTDVTVNCDTLVVDYADTKQPDGTSKTDVTNLDATGNVVIVTAKQRVTGQHATMDPRTNKLVVTGNVVVTQGATVIHGEVLHADLKTNQMDMTGGRVRGSFVPK
jgi:lipopolysaccharide export system protein LptA